MSSENRNLTDADVKAIVKNLHDTFIIEFYQNLGAGVWSMVWRMIIIAAVLLAAYGAYKRYV